MPRPWNKDPKPACRYKPIVGFIPVAITDIQKAYPFFSKNLNTGSGPDCMPQDVLEFSASVCLGHVSMEQMTYAEFPVPPVEEWRRYRWYMETQGGGGYGHRRLKWDAHNLLRQMGCKGPRHEFGWHFGRADAVCPKLQIAIECGSCPPKRILWTLEEPKAREIWVLPAVREGDQSIAYRFTRGPNFQRYLDRIALNFPTSTAPKPEDERSEELR